MNRPDEKRVHHTSVPCDISSKEYLIYSFIFLLILDTSNNSGGASTFAFGSAASKVSKPESTFSFGKTTENNDTTSEKSNDSDKIESAGKVEKI